jgi:hypothetical protein
VFGLGDSGYPKYNVGFQTCPDITVFDVCEHGVHFYVKSVHPL